MSFIHPFRLQDKILLYQRGLHNIENQLVFASNPQFVFHDSMGFEAGGTGELEAVKAFIASRAKATHMSKQLHAIWCTLCLNLLLLTVQANVFGC